MAYRKYAGAMLASGVLAAQPCAAAEDYRDRTSTTREMSAFAGVNVRLPLGSRGRARPSARMQFTASQAVRDSRGGSVYSTRPAGLEIGASGAGRPALFIGGQSTAEMRTKLGLGGSTGTTLLVVGGVVLVLVVVLAASYVPPQPDFGD